MFKSRPTFLVGLALIILGVVFLVTYFLPGAWPVLLVCLGLFFLVIAARYRVSWPVTTGLVNLVLGSILLYQTLTGYWKSWYILWPLIFSALGAGLLINDAIDRLPQGTGRSRYLRMSWAWLMLGLLASALLWFFRASISWPSIIWGIGALFLLAALISSIGPLAIPGTILGGLGLLLGWQNQTGNWDTWSFTWPLIPAFAGVGLILAFLNRRTMRIIGFSMLAWSLVAFALFGIFFAGDGALVYLWPAILIIAGIVILFQAFLARSTSRTNSG
jgi:hypothetical protein